MAVRNGLDILITRNRDHSSIGLATEKELSGLLSETPIRLVYPNTCHLSDWYFVSFRYKDMTEIFMLGYWDSHSWMAPNITGIDFTNKRVSTQSGLVYGFNDPGETYPSDDLIKLLMINLRRRQFGDILGLIEF